jgi:predicted AlkP superfamily phosphohydrolase/phosphomutase
MRPGGSASRVMIIGLDCAEPSLVFDRWRDELPTLSRLIDEGLHGPLMSVIPPITVPAWSCMMTSRSPGDLGVYGFRNRADHTYDALFIANGSAIREPRLWDFASRHGLRSIVLGVPGTYPPRPLNGVMVSCFLTPSSRHQFTYPHHLRREIEEVVGEYLFDCTEFRTEDKDDLLHQVYDMTDRRFTLADHFLAAKPWELFVMVEMGVDRMHHGFWKDMDPRHRRHIPGGRYENAILDYYRHVDTLIDRLLAHADDETAVLVVSDHGARRMDGGIRVNEWLMREGLLATLREPAGRTVPSEVGIDWSRTVAWGEGGYYGRVFLNVEGREPEGTVPASEYESVRDDLARRLAAIPDADGNPIDTKVFKPDAIYEQTNGVAPDLIVHFADLEWRAVGTIGGDEGVHTFENDTGPDDANHAQDGLLIMIGPGIPSSRREGMHLLDVAPTVLDLLGLEIPASMRGTSLLTRAEETAPGHGVAVS